MTHSPWLRFVGQNIRGTPAMSAEQVAHDVRVVKQHADVAVFQEFKWPWYWRVLRVAMLGGWAVYPSAATGTLMPVRAAQPVLWQRKHFRLGQRVSQVLHKGRAGISETRQLRSAQLTERTSGLRLWVGGTHFVVGGDGPHDGARRKHILMAEDLPHLAAHLDELMRSGDPIAFELDANIHRGTEAYPQLLTIVRQRGGKFHGQLGVEYLFTIPGRNARIEVRNAWTIPTDQLATDHEGRGITFRLVR